MSDKIEWRYPEHDGYPPGGSTCFLLTVGGGITVGNWSNSGFFIAWFPIPKRDRSKEPELYYERYGNTAPLYRPQT